MIPELAWLRRRAKRPGRPKHAVPADVLGGRTVLGCTATALIFPQVARTARSVLEPIGPADALRELSAQLDVLIGLAKLKTCRAEFSGSPPRRREA